MRGETRVTHGGFVTHITREGTHTSTGRARAGALTARAASDQGSTVNLSKLCVAVALGAVVGCGSANGGPIGPGGTGGAGSTGGAAGAGGTITPPPMDQSSFRLSCEFDTLDLNIVIELIVELTKPYSSSGSTETTFSASMTFDEESVASFLDAGITVIDIASASITTNVSGATPANMRASFGAAPINDFDLETDPDDNGIPGPHRFDLDPVTTPSTATSGASEVVFDLEFDGVSLVLGDFLVPMDCVGPSLVGVVVSFPVDP